MIDSLLSLNLVWRLLLIGALVTLALAPSTCGGSEPQGDNPGGNKVPALLRGFDEHVERVMTAWRIPGVAVGVVDDGKVVYVKAFGFRDLKKKTPVTIETIFPIGSITKSFTATAVGMLVDADKLSWNAPVRDYLPQFRLFDEFATSRATLHDLLTHRTGVPQVEMSWWWGTRQWLANHVTRQDIMKRLVHLKPVSGLREQHLYNNEMYVVLGLVIEAVSGKTWEEFTQRQILDPLGMKSTYLHLGDVPQSATVATGHYYRSGKQLGYQEPHQGRAIGPAGTLASNVPDMLKWVQFHVNRGCHESQRLLSINSADQLIQPHIALPGVDPPHHVGGFYGMGFMVFAESGRKKWVQHAGKMSDCTSIMGFVPAQRDGFVILTNWNDGYTYSPLQVMASNLADRFFNRKVKDRIKNYRQIDDRQWREVEKQHQQRMAHRRADAVASHPLKEFAGTYQHPVYQSIEIVLEKNHLKCLFHGRPGKLSHHHFDTFMVELGFAKYFATFRTNRDGVVDRMLINLEPDAEDFEFLRVGR